jgi:hypothetical protein
MLDAVRLIKLLRLYRIRRFLGIVYQVKTQTLKP